MSIFVVFQLELINKMEQLERFNDMIERQTVRLENLIHTIKDDRENTSATSLLDESIALNAVTIAVLQNINTCIHLLSKQVLQQKIFQMVCSYYYIRCEIRFIRFYKFHIELNLRNNK